jgi:hypothetical protein
MKHGKFPLFEKPCVVSFGINFTCSSATLRDKVYRAGFEIVNMILEEEKLLVVI